jgi:hypothetical protein
VGDDRGAGEGGFCFATSPGGERARAQRRRRQRRRLQTGPPRRCGGGGPGSTRVPPRAHSMYALTLCSALPSPPQASPHPEGVSAVLSRERPGLCGTVSVPSRSPSARVTHFAQLGSWRTRTTPAALPAGCHPLGGSGGRPTGRAPERFQAAELGGGGKEPGRRETKETRFPSQARSAAAAALFFFLVPRVGKKGQEAARAPAVAMPGAARACRRRRGRAGGARALGEKRARAEGALAVADSRQQVAPFPAAAARPLGRGAAGGWSGSACVRVCARRGAASARPSLGPARLPRPGGPFACPRSPPFPSASSILRARSQCLEPESPPARRGRILSGWNKTPQPGGAAPGRENARGETGAARGPGLSAGNG